MSLLIEYGSASKSAATIISVEAAKALKAALNHFEQASVNEDLDSMHSAIEVMDECINCLHWTALVRGMECDE